MTELAIADAMLATHGARLAVHDARLLAIDPPKTRELSIHWAGLTSGYAPPTGPGAVRMYVGGQWVRCRVWVYTGGQWN